MCYKYIFCFLFIWEVVFATGDDHFSDLRFRQIKENNRVFWDCRFHTDMPENTILVVRALFHNQEVPKSRRWCKVRKQELWYRLDPIQGKVLQGVYFFQITYAPQLQSSRHREKFSHQLAFEEKEQIFLGKEKGEEKELEKDLDFYGKILREINFWRKDLKKKGESYLETEKQENRKLVKVWLAQKHEILHVWKLDIQKQNSPEVFIPRSLKSIQGLKGALTFLEYLLQSYSHSLAKKYNLNLPYQKNPAKKKELKQCERTIDLYCSKVERYRASLKNKTLSSPIQSDREHDLVAAENLLKTLVKLNEQLQERLSLSSEESFPSGWSKAWQKEVSQMKKRMEAEKKLPPNIQKDLLGALYWLQVKHKFYLKKLSLSSSERSLMELKIKRYELSFRYLMEKLQKEISPDKGAFHE